MVDMIRAAMEKIKVFLSSDSLVGDNDSVDNEKRNGNMADFIFDLRR
jgi:hypothetical protein